MVQFSKLNEGPAAWDDDLYQLEDGVPPTGGVPDLPNDVGLLNEQARNLGARTRFLRGALGGIGGVADSIASLDAIDKTGQFQFAAGAAGSPDGALPGAVIHTELDGGIATQSVVLSDGRNFKRSRIDALPTWSAWTLSVTRESISASLAGNGYHIDPSGLIMQWGQDFYDDTEASAQIFFPISFPNNVFRVLVTDYTLTLDVSGAHMVAHFELATPSNDYFRAFTVNSSGVKKTSSFEWLAIGN